MLRIPGVPFLPGTLLRDTSVKNYARVQKLITKDGINMLSDRKPPCLVNDLGLIEDPLCPQYELPSFYPPKTGPKLPSWLAYNKKVLCFTAYFKQTLQEVYRAPYQVRTVKIYYYLEDDTMQISEPRVLNSGITQGCLLSRQKVTRPAPCHTEFYSMIDLNVNSTIKIFDKIYHIVNCDLFTRHFLNRAGIHVPDPVEIPPDPSIELRRKALEKPPTAYTKNLAYKQFLECDRKILNFYGYWNDKSEFGDIRNLEICYYLADDTIEVKEKFPVNSGRDAPGIFLKRSKLSKNFTGMPLPGAETRKTVLNVLGNRYVEDSLGTGARCVNYYKENDLQIGCHLNVYGRDVVLTDCDPFTKEYYRKKYGIEDFKPLKNLAEDYNQCVRTKRERQLPPFNGWGTHESSKGNCISVKPKIPQKDFKKFMKYDRFVLRYGAKMLSKITENCERIFIISYYLSDDTVSIYELARRNSGFLGGDFFKRCEILLPNQNLLTSKPPNHYRPQHFYVGSTINLRDHLFYITTADEYTFLFMENHPTEFPMADVKFILAKIREAIRPDYKNFIKKYLPEIVDNTGDNADCYLDFETIHRALVNILDKNISEHEIITLCRHFSIERPTPLACKRETVRAVTHLEIRRNLWDGLERLKEHIYHVVPCGICFLSRLKFDSIVRAVRLPFSKELSEDIFMVLNHNESDEIEISDFLKFIDVALCPAPSTAPVNIAFQLCPKLVDLSRGKLIHWKQFLDEIGLEEQLLQETE